MYKGLWNRRGRDSGFTVDWVLDRYLAERRPSQDARRHLEWWRGHLGTDVAGAVDSRRVLSLRDKLAGERSTAGKTRSPATINRYVAALSGLYSWAVEYHLVDGHPVSGVTPLDEGAARLRCLSPEEKQALIAACRETGGLRLQALVVVGLSTGARRGEILRLRWSDLDIKKQQLTIKGSGRLRSRTLPLPSSAMSLLAKLARVRRIDGNKIFADSHGRVRFPRAAWQAALEVAEIEDFRFHDLRHSTAAYLARNGASLPEIAQILGTRTLQGVRRYAGLTESQTPSVIGKMHEELFET
jgi:integrase